MASILGDGTGPGGPGTSRCLLLLQRSLAIQLTRGPPPHIANASQRESSKEHPADEMWMYDKGYNLFQVSCVYLYLCLYPLNIRYPQFYRVAGSSNCSFFDKHAFVISACDALFLVREITGAGKVCGSECRKRKRDIRRRRGSALRVSRFVLSSSVDARVLYGRADVDCPHRYTTMRQCELRAISQK